MKIKTTIFTLFFVVISGLQILSAQFDCSPATAESYLNANNVNALIKNGGNLWDQASYFVPKATAPGLPEVAPIWGGGIWIGGLDVAYNLKLAASTYGGNTGEVDYYPGPLSNVGQTYADQCEDYDRIWTTNSMDIESHKADWLDNGTIDGPIPASVLGWPGIGNPEFTSIFGFELVEEPQGYAPFFDRNGDGVYDPNEGDYPNINGADLGQWTVFNDYGGPHLQSGAPVGVGIEVQLLAYSFVSIEPAINNATFYDYKFINRNVESLDSTVIGIWIDPDLGCYTDDRVGCIPEDNMSFIYNADAIDGDENCSCAGGVNTYCEEIPVVGIKVLKGILAGRNINADGDLVPTPWGADPDTIVEIKMSSFAVRDASLPEMAYGNVIGYYNLLTGSWPDGTPLTEGGNGYNPGSTDYTKYCYPGNPSDVTDWSMCTEDIIGDSRMVIGIGEGFRMEPGDVKTMSFAVIAALDVAHPCPDVSVLQDVGDEVCDFYSENVVTNTSTPFYNESGLTLSPNPMNDQTQLSFTNKDEQLNTVQIYSVNGQLVRTYSSLSANSLSIEKGNLTTGMYFYKALSKGGKAYSGKFVVN